MFYSYGIQWLSRLFSAVPAAAVRLMMYILASLALHFMANQRGIRHGWLAWLPLGDLWILGSLSDQYRYVKRGQVKSKRKILLFLGILSTVLVLMALVSAFRAAAELVMLNPERMTRDMIIRVLMMAFAPAIGILIPWLVLMLVQIIVYYMALSDVFVSCDPETGTLFLVISIFVGILKPVFLFFDREKERGMPPRKREYTAVPEIQPEPVEETIE